MAYQIEYGYRAGDVLQHVQSVILVNQAPDQPKLGGNSEIQTTTRIVAESDGVLTVELQVQTLRSEGLLDQGGTVEAPPVTFTMDRSGAVLECSMPGLPAQTQAFPKEKIEIGTTWQTFDASNPNQPLSTTYKLEAVEDNAGEQDAIVVSEGLGENTVEEHQTLIQARMCFSLTHGHQKNSTTVVKTVWRDGRTSDVVIENKLIQIRSEKS